MNGRMLGLATPSLADVVSPAVPARAGFSCRNCGSPAVLLPRDLSAQALVTCDRCQSPVATLAAFRRYVGRLTAGAECCDHHLRVCRAEIAMPGSSTGQDSAAKTIID